jgi:uncharacterized protein YihD (DUF1040 family)
MRDIKRIEPLLIELKRVWEKNPDLRFFQITEMLKAKLGNHDAVYLEDNHVLGLLKKI